MRSCTTLLGLALLASAVAAQPRPTHSVAIVNDPKSHGKIGDNLLSLNEVFLLNMGRLKSTALSKAEQAQLTGFGDDIAWGDIDGSKVKVLTFERDLPVIEDTPHGLVISGFNGLPIIDIGNTKGFVGTSSFLDFRNCKIRGGKVAITLTQNDSPYGTVLENMTFEGQTEAALRVTYVNPKGKTTGEGRLQIEKTVFPNIPNAVQLTTLSPNRLDTLIISESKFVGGASGLAVVMGTAGEMFVTLERTVFDGVAQAIDFRHKNTTDARRILLDTAGLRISGGKIGMRYSGKGTSNSALNLRMIDATATQQTLQVGPLGHDIEVTVEDSRLAGNVDVAAGKHAKGLTLANLRARNASLTVGTTGGPLRMQSSILDKSAIATVGTTQLMVTGSRFAGGSATGTQQAPVRIQASYLGGLQIGSHATASGNLAAPQLGSMELVPLDPKIGTPMTLQADLPAKLSGVFVIGDKARHPTIGPRPFHFYFDTFFFVNVPGIVRGAQGIKINIPNNNYFQGRYMVAQMVVVPDPGFNAPAISLPPGRYIEFR